MRSLLSICVGLVVISGIISVNMWRELRAQHRLSEGLRTQLTDANARIQALTLAAQRPAFRPAAAVQAPVAAQTAVVPQARSESPAATRPPQAAITNARPQNQVSSAELMADPEYRRVLLASQRLSIESGYPGLVDELGLSRNDADKLFDLLAEQQTKMSAELSALNVAASQANGGRIDDAARAEITQKRQALQQQQAAEVAALLGTARNAQFQEYNDSRNGRQQATDLSVQLAQAGQVLNSAQQRGLGKVLAAEQKRLQQQTEPLMRSAQTDPQARLQMQEQALVWQQESNRRIVDAAAAYLTARQIAALREQHEAQEALSAAQLRVQRRRLEIQNSRLPQ